MLELNLSKHINTLSIALTGILVLTLLSAYGFSIPVDVSDLKDKALVLRGPSPIRGSDAKAATDLTLINKYLAVSIAVGSTLQGSVPQGSIIDAAVVVNGVVQQDFLTQFSFLVDGWGQWAKPTLIEVVSNNSKVASAKVVGYWKDIRVETTYVLEADKDYLYVKVVIVNTEASSYSLSSGWAMSLNRGWLYVPGVGTERVTGFRSDVGAFENWVAGYHEDYAVGLWAPGYNFLDTSTSSANIFFKYSMKPYETKEFEAYLIFVAKGNTCTVYQRILELRSTSYGIIKGFVTTTMGSLVKEPYVIVSNSVSNAWKPLCWAKGSQGVYSLTLPEGHYKLWAEAKGYGPSSAKEVLVKAGRIYVVNITDVKLPGIAKVKVYESKSGSPLDAKILVRGGPTSIIKLISPFTVAYTDFERVGYAELLLAPGNYTLIIGHGADDRYAFTSKPAILTNVIVEPGREAGREVAIERLIDPKQLGWYSTDLHHHSNYADGNTPPKDLVVAYLAADLDFVFVSDHDWVGNHLMIAKYAKARNISFIPSIEVSMRWGHFNPYPIPLGKLPKYGTTACELFKNLREAGAIVIKVNHPFRFASYFELMERNEIPGGYCPYWDVAEINSHWNSLNNRTATYLMSLWDYGLKYYLSAGSDVHDVWSQPYTGVPRVYAYLGNQTPTPDAFAWAEKYGHTFITYGPLIFSNPIPGSTMYAGPNVDKVVLKLRVVAVNGISRIAIVTKGRNIVYNNVFPGKPIEVNLTVELPVDKVLRGEEASWLSTIAWDANGNLAITNPVWISKSVVGMPATIASQTTTRETVTVIRWDITVATAIVFLVLGVILGYMIYRKR